MNNDQNDYISSLTEHPIKDFNNNNRIVFEQNLQEKKLAEQTTLTPDLIDRILNVNNRNTLLSMLGARTFLQGQPSFIAINERNFNNTLVQIRQRVKVNPHTIHLLQPSFLMNSSQQSVIKQSISNKTSYYVNEAKYSIYTSPPVVNSQIGINKYKLLKLVINSEQVQEQDNQEDQLVTIGVVRGEFLPYIAEDKLLYSDNIASNNNYRYKFEYNVNNIYFRYNAPLDIPYSTIGLCHEKAPIIHSTSSVAEVIDVPLSKLAEDFVSGNNIDAQQQQQLVYAMQISRDNQDVNNIINLLDMATDNEYIKIENKSDQVLILNFNYFFVYITNGENEPTELSATDQNLFKVMQVVGDVLANKDFNQIRQEYQKNQFNENLSWTWWDNLVAKVSGPLKELGIATGQGIINVINAIISEN